MVHSQPDVQPPLPSQQPLGQHDPSEHSSCEHDDPELELELELELLLELVSPLLEAPLELEPLVSPLLDELVSHPSPEESHASVQQTVPHGFG